MPQIGTLFSGTAVLRLCDIKAQQKRLVAAVVQRGFCVDTDYMPNMKAISLSGNKALMHEKKN